ncbi:hypothetical protein AVXHC19_45520 [Acidovorax sacchari]
MPAADASTTRTVSTAPATDNATGTVATAPTAADPTDAVPTTDATGSIDSAAETSLCARTGGADAMAALARTTPASQRPLPHPRGEVVT